MLARAILKLALAAAMAAWVTIMLTSLTDVSITTKVLCTLLGFGGGWCACALATL